MKLPVNRPKLNNIVVFSLLSVALGGAAWARAADAPARTPANGPAADYPIVLGAPFTIDGITYTPSDTMNYDKVGHAVLDDQGGGGITLANRTLPVPSYVEVTSLNSGKTILARVERRGPMMGDALVALSPGAAAQLGAADGHTPVRVRRVNPPEAERALLRAGQPAPRRMDTPMSLVAVLMRKLDPGAALPVHASTPPQAIAPAPQQKADVQPAKLAEASTAPKQAKPTPRTQMAPAAKGKVVVQVGAYSTRARADDVARKTGGGVTSAGKLWRVRIGSFAAATDAQGALAKARAAGYSDARIQRAD